MDPAIKTLIEDVKKDIHKIKRNAPLVHNITNFVVMNNTANALLAIGASPVMAHSYDEVEDMVKIASSLVINIGTLDKDWVESMIKAGKAAKVKGIPVIFDPVGAGATVYRTDNCKRIIEECKPDVIRGNASEIMALAGTVLKTKGVDSTVSSDEALDNAILLAKNSGSVVSMSGEIDYITNGSCVTKVFGGSPLMPKVTGMGCTATALTAAFASVNDYYMNAATNAMQLMSWAGEMAKEISAGPGSFQVNFLDMIYKISTEL